MSIERKLLRQAKALLERTVMRQSFLAPFCVICYRNDGKHKEECEYGKWMALHAHYEEFCPEPKRIDSDSYPRT